MDPYVAFCVGFAVAGGLFSALFLFKKIKHYSLVVVILKTLVSVCFIHVGVISAFKVGVTDYTRFYILPIILGQIWGMLGDISLDLKYAYPNDDIPFTRCGFAAFAVGHVMFSFAMLKTFMDWTHIWWLLGAVGFGILMTVAVKLLEKPMGMTYGKFNWIVLGYSFIIGTTMAIAVSMAIKEQFRSVSLNLMSLGMILFVLSDLILSGTYFGVGKDRGRDITSNFVAYYLAQCCIAFSILFIK